MQQNGCESFTIRNNYTPMKRKLSLQGLPTLTSGYVRIENRRSIEILFSLFGIEDIWNGSNDTHPFFQLISLEGLLVVAIQHYALIELHSSECQSSLELIPA